MGPRGRYDLTRTRTAIIVLQGTVGPLPRQAFRRELGKSTAALRQGITLPSSRSAMFCNTSRSIESGMKVTDPSPRRMLTPPEWEDVRGVLQFGWTCHVAVTGGFGVWRMVARLKHRPSVSTALASCAPV